MHSVHDVANYFLHRGECDDEGVTNLKLQKLVYYAQGFHLAIFGNNLFSDNVSAWVHGPVVPSLYHKYRDHGKNPISFENEDYSPVDVFDRETLEFLNEIYDEFGQYTAWSLRNMTHNEKPWLDHEKEAGIIPKSEIKSYFETRI